MAAKRAYAAAATAFSVTKYDAYLSSDKVLYPDLNCHSISWQMTNGGRKGVDPTAKPIKDHVAASAKNATKEVLKIGNIMMDGNHPQLALVEVLRETISPKIKDGSHENTEGREDMGSEYIPPSPIDGALQALEKEFCELSKDILDRSNEISRLIQLEESCKPLLHGSKKLDEKWHAMYQVLQAEKAVSRRRGVGGKEESSD